MKVTVGEKGLTKTWQNDFPKTTECCKCGGESRVGFVAHEGFDKSDNNGELVCFLYENEGKGNFWLHDYCAVAVYFCKDCLETTALYNQG